VSESLFTSQTPGIPNISEAQTVTVATTVYFATAGSVSGCRFFAPTTIGGTFEAALYEVTADDNPAASGTGTLLGTATFGTLTTGAWNTVSFSSPISVTTGKAYRVGVRTSEGRYAATSAFFNASGLTNGNITAPQTGTNPGAVGIGNLDNGSFIESITVYPNKTFNGNCYFVDVIFDAASGNATVSASTVAAVAAVPSATVRLSSAITASTVAAVASVPSATVRLSAAISPSTVAAVAAVPSATVRLSVLIPAVGVSAVAAVGSATVSAQQQASVSASTVAAVAAIGTPVVTAGGSASITASTVAAVAAVPSATASGGALAVPATVAAVAGVGAVVASAGARAVPATVAAVATVPAAAVSLPVLVTPATVAATAAVGVVTFRSNATVIAGTVAVTVTVPRPAVTGVTVVPVPNFTHVTATPLMHVAASPLLHVGQA
jgi:hypothetical protein